MTKQIKPQDLFDFDSYELKVEQMKENTKYLIELQNELNKTLDETIEKTIKLQELNGGNK